MANMFQRAADCSYWAGDIPAPGITCANLNDSAPGHQKACGSGFMQARLVIGLTPAME